MLKYKYLLFDNDGTLADTIEVILKSFKYAMKTVLNEDNPDCKKYCGTIGLPTKDQMRHFSDDEKVIEQLVCEYRAKSDELLGSMIKNYDGLPEVLNKLKSAGYNLGVVTSKRHQLTLQGLQDLGIDQYFDYLQGSDDWHIHKPNPGAISYAVEQLGLQPNEVIYIGDAPFDLIAGGGAGVDTCGVTWGAFDRKRLQEHNPTYLIDKPQQLLEILL